MDTVSSPPVPLRRIAREWARLGVTGFGGPPAHIQLLRTLCVERTGWLAATEFEDAVAACNLLPGPASTQLAIYCARRAGGWRGAIVGGLGFILPGLIVILVLSALLLGPEPSPWVLGAAAGAGAVIPAIAVRAGVTLMPASLLRARGSTGLAWWVAAVAVGAVAAAVLGAWVVIALVGCGLIALARQQRTLGRGRPMTALVLAGTLSAGGWLALAWTAFKVGALSYGGGFVIVPLMQSDAIEHHWLTKTEFLGAVALGQVTPGPVVQTVAVVGYGAAGLAGGVAASAIAFAPSFVFVLAGGRHFDRVRTNPRAQAFLTGAGPAAIGAIVGSAVPLAFSLGVWWQAVVLAVGSLALLRRWPPLVVIVLGGAVGLALVALGAPVPR
jgi:chromate transporter